MSHEHGDDWLFVCHGLTWETEAVDCSVELLEVELRELPLVTAPVGHRVPERLTAVRAHVTLADENVDLIPLTRDVDIEAAVWVGAVVEDVHQRGST
jgi:hypothetical protein